MTTWSQRADAAVQARDLHAICELLFDAAAQADRLESRLSPADRKALSDAERARRYRAKRGVPTRDARDAERDVRDGERDARDGPERDFRDAERDVRDVTLVTQRDVRDAVQEKTTEKKAQRSAFLRTFEELEVKEVTSAVTSKGEAKETKNEFEEQDQKLSPSRASRVTTVTPVTNVTRHEHHGGYGPGFETDVPLVEPEDISQLPAVEPEDVADAEPVEDVSIDPALRLSAKLGSDGAKAFKAFLARHGVPPKSPQRKFFIEQLLETLVSDNCTKDDALHALRDDEINPVRALNGLRQFVLQARNSRLAEERARSGGGGTVRRDYGKDDDADANDRRRRLGFITARRQKQDGDEWWQRMMDSARRAGTDVYDFAYAHISDPVGPAPERGKPETLRALLLKFAPDVVPQSVKDAMNNGPA